MVTRMARATTIDHARRVAVPLGDEQGRLVIVRPARDQPVADELADVVVAALASEPYLVRSVAVGRSVVNDVVEADPDVVLLIDGPGTDDLPRLCRTLRALTTARILVLASFRDEPTIIDVLDAGADDVIISTATERIVSARIRVAMRSRPIRPRRSRRIELGDLLIDTEAHVVSVGGTIAKCPPLQYQLLLALAERPGETAPRDHLIDELWGVSSAAFNPRRLRVAVSLLRTILGTGPQRPTIERVLHVGYRLVPAP